jgi:hypothetical protein
MKKVIVIHGTNQGTGKTTLALEMAKGRNYLMTTSLDDALQKIMGEEKSYDVLILDDILPDEIPHIITFIEYANPPEVIITSNVLSPANFPTPTPNYVQFIERNEVLPHLKNAVTHEAY